MIINKITLKNFKSYADETTLNLKPDNDKNIVLIGGENGAGKSTLFEAMKICIYGPTSFGYMGQNHYYTNYIKSVINTNALSQDIIESFVSLEISLNNSVTDSNYILTRSWTYCDQKLSEIFTVKHNDMILENEQLDFFEQYLKSVLPPYLFEYFFFDGENLNNFFSNNNSSTDLYNAVIKLLNYDSFDLLKKQLNSYNIMQSKNKVELENAQNKYEEALNELNEVKNKILKSKDEKSQLEVNLNDLQLESDQLYVDFKKSGGLLSDERNHLQNRINELENLRIDINLYIKNFCNDNLPFIILKKQLLELVNQINKEENIISYNLLREKLNTNLIFEALERSLKSKEISKIEASLVAKNILDLIYIDNNLEGTKDILRLSKDQSNHILGYFNNILSNKDNISSEIIKHYKDIKNISEELKTLNSKVKSSSSEEHLNDYLNKNNIINDQISKSTLLIQQIDDDLIMLEQELIVKEAALNKAKNINISLLQSSNISNITDVMQKLLDELIDNLTKDKISNIQNEFLYIFKQIIRKENFIDNIVIDNNFKTTLYIKKDYNKGQLLNILNNIGYTSTPTTYGDMFFEDLKTYICFDSDDTLTNKLESINSPDNFELQTKVNLNSLSNGEKQIYILCLIWAILKVSNVEIPFIIDTPYSRIDSTHRNGLTNIYLPNISKQVIVLSTNEEIDSELYKTIKPYVAQEYLLVYDTVNRKTTVTENYFRGGKWDLD